MHVLHKVLYADGLFDIAYFLVVFIVVLLGIISFLVPVLWYTVRGYDATRLTMEQMRKYLSIF